MKQLIMNWQNDGTLGVEPVFPEGIECKSFPELPDALNTWLDIIGYLDGDEYAQLGRDYYEKTMLSYKNLDENMCYFLTVDGVPAATITVICDYETKHGYIHMVTCKPNFRGRGLGHLLNEVAVYVLKREGMETAHLTTDDWRIAAIKTYLKAGLTPELESSPDYKERWEKIYSKIGC